MATIFMSVKCAARRNSAILGAGVHYQDGAPRITFQNFVVGPGGYGNAKLGFWDIEVDRSWFGSLRLPLDRDLGYYYIKKGG